MKGSSFNTWQDPSYVVSLHVPPPEDLVRYVIHIVNGLETVLEPQISCYILK